MLPVQPLAWWERKIIHEGDRLGYESLGGMAVEMCSNAKCIKSSSISWNEAVVISPEVTGFFSAKDQGPGTLSCSCNHQWRRKDTSSCSAEHVLQMECTHILLLQLMPIQILDILLKYLLRWHMPEGSSQVALMFQSSLSLHLERFLDFWVSFSLCLCRAGTG